jgi:GT2 family glycosyltransferase
VGFVVGTAPFYRRQGLDKVGLLNEQFCMYLEDVEFCLRVKAETGYRVCMLPERLVTHYISVCDMESIRMKFCRHRNLILILRKYRLRSIPITLLCFFREIINLLLVCFRSKATSQLSLARAPCRQGNHRRFGERRK